MKPDLRRMEVGGEGTGEFGRDEIERRARELARSDGRAEANEGDIAQAREELSGAPSGDINEPGIDEDDRVEAGVPVGAIGHQAERFELDDEQEVPRQLVEEGIEEAEHDSRVHSNDGLPREEN